MDCKHAGEEEGGRAEWEARGGRPAGDFFSKVQLVIIRRHSVTSPQLGVGQPGGSGVVVMQVERQKKGVRRAKRRIKQSKARRTQTEPSGVECVAKHSKAKHSKAKVSQRPAVKQRGSGRERKAAEPAQRYTGTNSLVVCNAADVGRLRVVPLYRRTVVHTILDYGQDANERRDRPTTSLRTSKDTLDVLVVESKKEEASSSARIARGRMVMLCIRSMSME